MAKFIWITFLVAAAVCAANAANAGRIIGGSATTIDQYPGVVQVESRLTILWSQTCAGAILNTITILSSAGCFDGVILTTRNRRIRAGATQRGYGGATYPVDRITHHPSYGTQGYDGDICVVRLESRMVYGPTIQPVAIPPQDFILPENLPVKFLGWGSMSNEGSSSDVLRVVETFTMELSLCSQLYSSLSRPQVITYNMICAGHYLLGGVGFCDGDEGAPMFYDGIAMAVNAFSESCKDPRMPSVGTSISSYTNWVVQSAA